MRSSRAKLAGTSTAATAGAPAWRTLRRPAVALPAIGVVVALAAWMGTVASERSRERWAREEALPQMLALIANDDYAAALALAEQVEAVLPNDPALADAIAQASVTAPIVTDPPGADVYVRSYDDRAADWRLVGRSPIEAERLPRRSAVEIRVEKEGFDPVEVASGVPGFFFRPTGAPPITLRPSGAVPPEMVFVPGGDFPVRITGFNTLLRAHLDAFLIDRYEVTNAEYKEFVDAGGYSDPRYWEGLDFVRDGRRLSWEEAAVLLVDQTGRPGPSTWEFGTFPPQQEAYPVSGVSWYEAVAYNRFREKSLPTIYHWARAAIEPDGVQVFVTHLLAQANFNGEGPLPVVESRAMGPYGTYDTAGNVKEWAWNASGDHRWLLGGAWDDEQRMYSVRFTSPTFDRSSRHGFRGVRYVEGEPNDSLAAPVESFSRDYNAARPVSEAVYQAYRRPLLYVPGELDAREESVDDTLEEYRRIKVTLDAGYVNERMAIYLFLPKGGAPPYQAAVFFPGLDAFMNRSTGEPYPTVPSESLGAVVSSGRAVIIPTWSGSMDRWDDFDSQSGEQSKRSLRTKMAEWTEDLGRTIDYLESRDDIDAERIFYFGVSFGSSTSLPLLDLESRLRAALLLLPGYTYRQVPPEMDAVNYAPHITMPVLMIGGRDDYVFPVEIAQRPLFEQLGTPAADKRHLLYPMGHGPIPRGQFLRDVLPWLDQYLGPVR
ncbi:MAG: hypothetical protein EXR91_04495 [Gemmatimonadetes bacterium]|nr:hypothetical protein [Gemmatimonadota bacterium]